MECMKLIGDMLGKIKKYIQSLLTVVPFNTEDYIITLQVTRDVSAGKLILNFV